MLSFWIIIIRFSSEFLKSVMILRCKCSFGTIWFSSKLGRNWQWSEVGIYPKGIGPSQKYPKTPRRGTIYKTTLNTIKIKPRFFFTLAQPRFKKLLQPCKNYNEILIWHLLGVCSIKLNFTEAKAAITFCWGTNLFWKFPLQVFLAQDLKYPPGSLFRSTEERTQNFLIRLTSATLLL